MVLHLFCELKLTFRNKISERVDHDSNHQLWHFLFDTAGIKQPQSEVKYVLVLSLAQILSEDHLVNVADLRVDGRPILV